LPFVLAAGFGALIPLPFVPALYPGELMLALAYGLLTAAAFALWPLGRGHDIPVSALFRDHVTPGRRYPRARYIVATIAAVIFLAVLAVVAADCRRIAILFVFPLGFVLLLLRLVAGLPMLAARKLPHARSTVLRIAIANIHRPAALTPTVVLSLGLGLALLVTVLQIDGNLRHQLTAALPEKAPSFYFFDIQADVADCFVAFVTVREVGSRMEWMQMRCRGI